MYGALVLCLSWVLLRCFLAAAVEALFAAVAVFAGRVAVLPLAGFAVAGRAAVVGNVGVQQAFDRAPFLDLLLRDEADGGPSIGAGLAGSVARSARMYSVPS